MADLVIVNPPQDRGALPVPDPLEPGRHLGCHIEAARLEDERHDGQPCQQIVGGRRRRFPQPVMRRQVAVAGSELGEPARQQLEMQRLFASDADPIVIEGRGQRFAGKPGNDVPGEIDGVELDMREGMEQRDPPGRRAEIAPLRHFLGRAQNRSLGPCRTQRRRSIADLGRTAPPLLGQPTAGRRFRRRVRRRKDRDRAGRQCRSGAAEPSRSIVLTHREAEAGWGEAE